VAGSFTLCDIQNPASNNNPGNGAEVTFPDPLVVTLAPFTLSTANGTVVKAFFVAEGQGGPYRGALVRGDGAQIDALNLTVGSRLNLTGRVDEFAGTGLSTETQLLFIGGTVVGSPGVAPAATPVGIGAFGNDAAAEAYEGVLITVANVSAIRFDSGAIAEFGAFRLDGNLLVDDQLFRYRAGIGETFTSITGFLRYSYDGKWSLLPRDAADVVSSGNPLTPRPTAITEIQDPANAATVPHCLPTAECDPLLLTNMVVVSGVRVADKDSTGKSVLFSVFVQDPTRLDADGQPLPYSGIKLTFSRTQAISNTFTYVVYGDTDLPDTRDSPTTWPQIGDVITVEGTAQEYFTNSQIGGVTRLDLVGSFPAMTAPSGVINPKPKSLTGESVLAGLAGGRHAEAMCVDAVSPGEDAEQWEGVLLKLENVATTLACVPTASASTSPPDCIQADFGYFQVTGGVEIGTSQGVFFADRCATGVTCTCDGPNLLPPARNPDMTRSITKTFTSITGIYDFSFDVFRVNPRTEADVVVAPQ